jgi:hypothetical protein
MSTGSFFIHYLSPRHRSNLQSRTRILYLSVQSSSPDIDREVRDQVLPGRSRTGSGYPFCPIFRGARCTCPTIVRIFPLPLRREVRSLGLALAEVRTLDWIGLRRRYKPTSSSCMMMSAPMACCIDILSSGYTMINESYKDERVISHC